MTTEKIQRRVRPVHPGEVLREDVLPALEVTQGEFATALGVSRKTISEILNERSSVTVDMAHRLARALDSTPGLWLRMQQAVDLWDAQQANAKVYSQVKRLRVA